MDAGIESIDFAIAFAAVALAMAGVLAAVTLRSFTLARRLRSLEDLERVGARERAMLAIELATVQRALAQHGERVSEIDAARGARR